MTRKERRKFKKFLKRNDALTLFKNELSIFGFDYKRYIKVVDNKDAVVGGFIWRRGYVLFWSEINDRWKNELR